jgi:hypothetical protein
MGAWLASRGVDLPPARRELATAFAHALAARGDEARAALDRAAAAGGVLSSEQATAEAMSARPMAVGTPPADSVLARAGAMKGLELLARERIEERRGAEAAVDLSKLLLAEVDGTWASDSLRLAAWSEMLATAQREHRWSRRGSWASHEITVKSGDSLISVRKRALAERPGLVVCTGQIARANELVGEVIHPGARLRIPVDAVSVLVDLSSHWALYMAGSEVVAAWPVGVGKDGSTTQAGEYVVGEKLKNPMWFPQGRAPVPFGDPENPLGTRWIKWLTSDGRETGLGFHGTNEPQSIGKNASQGCIRMRQADVEELYEIVPVGAVVRVVP